jgi:hypothetical protein
MPHTKTSGAKEFHRDIRKARKWQRILFQAIPKLFARTEPFFESLQIESMSFWIKDSQCTVWGKGQYKFDKIVTGVDDDVCPYISGFVRFKHLHNYTSFQFRTSSQPYDFTEKNVFQLSDWQIIHVSAETQQKNALIKRIIAEWYRDTLNMFKMSKRMNRFKKDIIAAAWHPRRVERWLEAGVQLEDL